MPKPIGHTRPDPGDQLHHEQQQLRDLIRDAHAAVKDLRSAVRDAQAIAARAGDIAHEHICGEIIAASAHLQRETNKRAVELNAAVTAARQEIMRQISLSELILDPDRDSLRFVFQGTQFNTDPRPDLTGDQPLPGA